jgi:hypothetical protein
VNSGHYGILDPSPLLSPLMNSTLIVPTDIDSILSTLFSLYPSAESPLSGPVPKMFEDTGSAVSELDFSDLPLLMPADHSATTSLVLQDISNTNFINFALDGRDINLKDRRTIGVCNLPCLTFYFAH